MALYNQHDLFEKLKNTPVSIESSLKDVLMNYLRGRNFVKVVVEFKEITQGVWNLLLYDIDNTGSTPHIVENQLLYVVSDKNKIKEEAGKLGVHGMGLKQLLVKITSAESVEVGGGISALTQRNGENGDKHFEITGVNPYNTGNSDSIKNVQTRNLDSISDSSFTFPSDLMPTTNYLAINIPGVNFDAFDFASNDKTSLQIMADMVATYFVLALDNKVISFHFRKTDLQGNNESIDVETGAKFVDEYGNFISYYQIPKTKQFETGQAHKYPAKFLQSTKLTPELREEAKQKNIRIFGDIPELNKKHEDNWRGYVIDASEGVGVILGEYEEGRAAGHSFSIMFAEIPVENTITDTNKNSVKIAGTRIYRQSEGVGESVLGMDGIRYRPITRTGIVNSLFKEYAKMCNPNQQFKETSRRDLGLKLLKGFLPYIDETYKQSSISVATLKEYLSIYHISMESDLSKIAFPKEISFFNNRVILDQGVISETYCIANEWKKKETDIEAKQIISEITGWFLTYGSYPNEFIISCDSVAESIPMDYFSNFSDTTTDLIEDLKNQFTGIKFTLVDTRYFELNRKHGNFKSYRKDSLLND